MRIIEKVAKIMGFIECYLYIINKLFIFGFDVSKGFHNILEIILWFKNLYIQRLHSDTLKACQNIICFIHLFV